MTTLHDLLTRAVGLHQAGETDRAAALYRSILAVDPARTDALRWQAATRRPIALLRELDAL